jgi:hypothetical protein
MPTYLLQMRWTGQGYDNLKNNMVDGPGGIRATAKRYAANNGVTVRVIYDTLKGPDWIVLGTSNAVDGVIAHFVGENNVNIVAKYQIGDEPDHDRDNNTIDN